MVIEGTKTNTARRRVVLPPLALSSLREMPRWFDSPWVFVSKTGRRFTGGILHRNFDKVRQAYGRPDLVPYALRHACATNLMRRGLEPWAIARQLGHDDHGALVSTLYGHPSERDARDRIKRAYGQNVTPLTARLQHAPKGIREMEALRDCRIPPSPLFRPCGIRTSPVKARYDSS
jgi:integrase